MTTKRKANYNQPKLLLLAGEKMPDMPNALCKLPENLPIIDRGFDDSEKWRNEAKALCFQCPEKVTCGKWAYHEDPPGSWGGVYGGMDAEERRNAGSRGQVALGTQDPQPVPPVHPPEGVKTPARVALKTGFGGI